MKYETIYGTVELRLVDGGFEVVSDIPFKREKRVFSPTEYNKAVDYYKHIVNEVNKIINEMESKKKRFTTTKSEVYNKVYKLIKGGFRKILLYGPTGTGKTYTSIEVLKSLKGEGFIDDYIVFTMSSGMEDIDLLGKFLPDEKKALKFNESELLQFMKRNKDKKIAILIDEFNRAHSKTLNILIPMLDGRNGKVVVNNYIANETIELPEENVIFLFSANFGASYSGTFQVDEAILNRFDLALFVDYQKTVEDVILSELPEDKRRVASEIKDFLRDAYKNGIIHPFTTRDLQTLVRLLKTVSSLTPKEVYSAVEPILHKVVKVDVQGYPDEEFLDEFKEFLNKTIGGGE